MFRFIKFAVFTIFLVFLSFFFFRWVITLAILIFSLPFLVIFQIVQINFSNFAFPVHYSRFPLVMMSPKFLAYYKPVYLFIKSFAFFISLLLLIYLTSKYQKYGVKQLIPDQKMFIEFAKLFGFFVGGLIFIFITLTPSLLLPTFLTYSSGQKALNEIEQVSFSVKRYDLENASIHIRQADFQINEALRNLQKMRWAEFVPYVRNYYQDVNHGIRALTYTLTATSILIDSVKPYTDELRSAGQENSLIKNEEKAARFLSLLDKIKPGLDPAFNNLSLALKEIEYLDPQRYPEKIGGYTVREKIIEIKELGSRTEKTIPWAKTGLKILPQLAGYPQSRKYLFLFQNDKELRPTGGFINAYGIFLLNQGNLKREGSDDIYNLDKTLTQNLPAPASILNHLPGVKSWYLRDSNLSPDFSQSMQNFEKIYQYSIHKTQYDGIIAIDSYVLLELLRILGPTVVGEKVFQADNDSRCQCPQVIYEIQVMAENKREDISGLLVNGVLLKSLTAPRELWLPLSKTLLKLAEEKHILIFLRNEGEQRQIENLPITGRIVNFDGDYLHINDTNFAGGKSNLYVKHFVKQEINIQDDGSLIKKITLEYKNQTLPSECNLKNDYPCLNTVLRNWLRVYVPRESELLEFKGLEGESSIYQDLDKTVFEGFLTVKPLSRTEVVIHYKLPFRLRPEDSYRILIQKQPGTEGHEYEIAINGKTKERFFLRKDRQFEFKRE